MVSQGIGIELKDFQREAVGKLLRLAENPTNKKTVIVKSPTGSGKTIFLIDFVDKYLTDGFKNVAFIWLCPGQGDLEEQSRDKMRKFAPYLPTQSLLDALTAGFGGGTTTFINWELVTKRGNTALQDSERKNLFDQIDAARRAGTEFIIIIDEEHYNNTSRANDIINAFYAKLIIRVSATAKKKRNCEFIEIDEQDVIDSGLITRALYVNDGIMDNMEIDEKGDYNYLLELADNRRKEIAAAYNEIGKNIRPLVIVQFPNGDPQYIENVEKKLEEMGYTYKNGMVAKRLSGNHEGMSDDLISNNGQQIFILMKQALATGWDCPRAKILVKLREGMDRNFEIQTIGRIRRMPEAQHYGNELLDCCYLYTFDTKYKNGLLSTVETSSERRRVFLKEKCKSLTLEKENCANNEIGERNILEKIYKFFVKKYHMTGSERDNRSLLEAKEYQFGDEIIHSVLYGRFISTEALAESNRRRTLHQKINISIYSPLLRECSKEIQSACGIIERDEVSRILRRLFKKTANIENNIFKLSEKDFYAFVINNLEKLKKDFREATAGIVEQENLGFIEKSIFHIPEQESYCYKEVRNEKVFNSNAYEGYTSGMVIPVRSKNEVSFERYCETRKDIDWVYKNGDKGSKYFSIVYSDAFGKHHLFYPDYIVKKKDGAIWIIEVKGGEVNGQNQNIDPQAANKFNALKAYASKNKDINWGFVRDLYDELYISNTEFEDSMEDEHWRPIGEML